MRTSAGHSLGAPVIEFAPFDQGGPEPSTPVRTGTRRTARSRGSCGVSPRRRRELDERFLKAPKKPLSLVVISGIFAEFIEQVPFQSVVSQKESRFGRQWQATLEEGVVGLGGVYYGP